MPLNNQAGLLEKKHALKQELKNKNDAERWQFEYKMGINVPTVKFDYTLNVFTLRGNWKKQIRVVTLTFPFDVNIKLLKKLEEVTNKWLIEYVLGLTETK